MSLEVDCQRALHPTVQLLSKHSCVFTHSNFFLFLLILPVQLCSINLILLRFVTFVRVMTLQSTSVACSLRFLPRISVQAVLPVVWDWLLLLGLLNSVDSLGFVIFTALVFFLHLLVFYLLVLLLYRARPSHLIVWRNSFLLFWCWFSTLLTCKSR